MKRIPALAIALTLAGCASPWTHPVYGTDRLQQDAADCDLLAQTSTANLPTGAMRGFRLAEIGNACMRQRGYQ